MDACRGHDVVIACGGVGLAPLRPAIYHIIEHRAGLWPRVPAVRRADAATTCCTPTNTTPGATAGIEVEVTVDLGDADWRGHIGVVPVLFYRLRLNAAERRASDLRAGDHDAVRDLRGPGPQAAAGTDLHLDGTEHEVRAGLLRPLPARPGVRLQGRPGVHLRPDGAVPAPGGF